MNEPVKLGLLSPNFKIKNYDGAGIRILVAFLGSGYLCLMIFVNLNIVLAIITFFLFTFLTNKYIRFFLPDWVRKSDFKGEIQLFKDAIEIQENNNFHFNLAELAEIEIHSNYYRGFHIYKNGTKNGLGQLKLKLKSNDIKSFKFCIFNQEEFNNFIEILKYWYSKEIQIKETGTDYQLKAFLLQTDLNYAKIQQLKLEIKQHDRSN